MGKKYSCCCNYHNILYIAGYGWKYSPILKINDMNEIENKSVVIEVKINDSNINVKKIETNHHISKRRIAMNVLYNLIVAALISWQIVYAVVNDINNGAIDMIKNIIFQFVFLSQYIVGSIYFSDDHFYKIIKVNKKVYSVYSKAIYFGLLITIILVIVCLSLLNKGYNIGIYSKIYGSENTKNKVLINILLVIECFFSYISYIINMITFSTVMIYHRKKINTYSDKIQNDTNNMLYDLIVKVAEEFHNMRDEYANTITNINGMFNMLNIFGMISLYVVFLNIYDKNAYTMDIINMVFFIIIETTYIYSINKVRKCIDNIKSKMTSGNIITQIMSKSFDKNLLSKIDITAKSNIFDISYHSLTATIKNVEVLNWTVLNHTLSTEWETFNFLGFPITDTLIVQKILSMLFAVVLAKSVSDVVSF